MAYTRNCNCNCGPSIGGGSVSGNLNLNGTLSPSDMAIGGSLSLLGKPGLSAYEIAKLHGFRGTEAEWLESLKATCDCDQEAVAELVKRIEALEQKEAISTEEFEELVQRVEALESKEDLTDLVNSLAERVEALEQKNDCECAEAMEALQEQVNNLKKSTAALESADKDIEEKIDDINAHPPIASEDGKWMVWDKPTQEYIVTEVDCPLNPPAISNDMIDDAFAWAQEHKKNA